MTDKEKASKVENEAVELEEDQLNVAQGGSLLRVSLENKAGPLSFKADTVQPAKLDPLKPDPNKMPDPFSGV